MYIVIGGAGLVGGELARKLAANKHDVVMIEANADRCDQLYAETGVIAVHGSIADIEVLQDAELHKADVLVATTEDDADNLAAALIAKSAGVPQVIARMRNPAYETAYERAGVDSLLRVTDLLINRMLVEIESPDTHKVSSILQGQADIHAVRVPAQAAVDGMTVQELAEKPAFSDSCSFVAINRPDTREIIIPKGDNRICAGDEVFIISPPGQIAGMVKLLTETA